MYRVPERNPDRAAIWIGWSPATTVRMAKRYGHIGQVAQRQAVEILDVKRKKNKKRKRRDEVRNLQGRVGTKLGTVNGPTRKDPL